MITPTYEHYGTHDDSEYPELWDGCIGAWAPGLGATGSMMFDLSGSGNHAYINGSAPTSVWEVANGMSAIAPASNADAFIIGRKSPLSGLSCFTIAATVTPGPIAQYKCVFGNWNNADTSQLSILFRLHEGGVQLYVYTGTPYGGSVGVTAPTNVRASIVVMLSGGTISGYYNGIAGSTPISGVSGSVRDTTESLAISGKGNIGHSDACFNGKIFSVACFSRAISLGEIMLLNTPLVQFAPRSPRRFYSFADVSNRRRRFFLGAAA